MASGKNTPHYNGATAADIARFGVRRARGVAGAFKKGRISLEQTDRLMADEHAALRRKVIACVVTLAVLSFFSLSIMGAAGRDYAFVSEYEVLSPIQVAYVLYLHAYNFIGSVTHLFSPYEQAWLMENAYGYYAIPERAGVIGITLVCAVLLAVSGALYQAVFRNPIAGPGMLGVGSGVSMGMMLLVYLFGASASGMLVERYAYCYGFGAAILAFVIFMGRKLSGKGKPYDIVTMLLLGSILSQLLGFVVSYVTLFVMDPGTYEMYYALSQMLVVDTSPVSWACLGVATLVSFVPIWHMRFKLNALAFDEQEVRLLGINATALRALALVCGAIMILAAQIHTGAVAMVSLIVPFLSRSWFGCEFRKQLAGNICIGTILLLVCRDVADLIPFVGDGIAIGSIVAVFAMPLFLVIVAKSLRGWE